MSALIMQVCVTKWPNFGVRVRLIRPLNRGSIYSKHGTVNVEGVRL